jgi:hypothetical protein
VTIDSVGYDYTASIGEDEEDILDAIKVLIDAGSWPGDCEVDGNLMTLTDLDDVFSYDVGTNMDIVEVSVYGDFTATTTGANPLPANSLTEIVTPVVGWNSVLNLSAGTTGTELETDDALRIRRAQSILIGNATEGAILNNVFNNITGITNVAVYSNRTDSIDVDGRPPHSFEVVVQGGDDVLWQY